MEVLCLCWVTIHNLIILQHNKIKTSFGKSLNVMSNSFKGSRYRRLVGRVSRYGLRLIVEDFEQVKHIRFDSENCGCISRWTYALLCACELARYDHRMTPMTEIHIIWTRLSFSNNLSNESKSKLWIQCELDVV